MTTGKLTRRPRGDRRQESLQVALDERGSVARVKRALLGRANGMAGSSQCYSTREVPHKKTETTHPSRQARVG